jgi:hypothetical protein
VPSDSRSFVPSNPGTTAASSVRTTGRSKNRRKAAPLARVGMLVFAIGLIAVFTDMILFAAGSRNLPLWLNLLAMLAPLGLGLGLVGVVRENRAASPALAARKASDPARPRISAATTDHGNE